MTEEFSDLAGKLLDRINSISFQQRRQKAIDTMATLNKGEFRKTSFNRPAHSTSVGLALASPQTQTLLELSKIEQELGQNQEENIRKLKNLNQEIRKLEVCVKEETETRLKIHENFIHSVVKAQKNMQTTMSNIRKLYSQRQKKLQQKIQQVLKHEKSLILQQLQSNHTLSQTLTTLTQSLHSLKQQLTHMKRSRLQLEQKITKQFNDQLRDLKAVFTNSIKMREERQLRILEMLKDIYKRAIQGIKKEELEREASQRMFLGVIEQLIDRITQA